MLIFENSRNRFETKRKAIEQFLEENVSVYVDESRQESVEKIATAIRATGVKSADSIHAACAILANCDYLLTTDDRLLKYKTDQLRIVDPTEFVRIIGGESNEYR